MIWHHVLWICLYLYHPSSFCSNLLTVKVSYVMSPFCVYHSIICVTSLYALKLLTTKVSYVMLCVSYHTFYHWNSYCPNLLTYEGIIFNLRLAWNSFIETKYRTSVWWLSWLPSMSTMQLLLLKILLVRCRVHCTGNWWKNTQVIWNQDVSYSWNR